MIPKDYPRWHSSIFREEGVQVSDEPHGGIHFMLGREEEEEREEGECPSS